jgi:hypothetical protein
VRGLDYLRFTAAISDRRLADPVELLCAHPRRAADQGAGTLTALARADVK